MSIQERTIYCDCCNRAVCTGRFRKKLIVPYVEINPYKRLVLLDEWGIDKTDTPVKAGKQHVCHDCYRKIITAIRWYNKCRQQ